MLKVRTSPTWLKICFTDCITFDIFWNCGVKSKLTLQPLGHDSKFQTQQTKLLAMVGSEIHPICFQVPNNLTRTPREMINSKTCWTWQGMIVEDPRNHQPWLRFLRRSRSLYNRVPQEERGEKCLGLQLSRVGNSHKPWLYFGWFQQEHVGATVYDHTLQTTQHIPTRQLRQFVQNHRVIEEFYWTSQDEFRYWQGIVGISTNTYWDFSNDMCEFYMISPKLNGKELNKDAISATETCRWIPCWGSLSLSLFYIYIYMYMYMFIYIYI